MLSLFPSLLSWQPLAPFLLRILLGAVLLYWAYGKIKNRTAWQMTTLGLVEGIAAILLIVGFLMQLGALIAFIILLVKTIQKIRYKSLFTDGINYYFILLVISFCLLILGPGRFAFDLPL